MKLELKQIKKDFKDVEVLSNVTITFKSGLIYGIIGRNGSGKSVLLKIICSFYEPSSGVVLYDGVDINKNKIFPPNTRALIEKPNFLPDLTGKENLVLLASIQKKIGEKEIDDILKKVDLYDDKDKKYHKYSLGMKQKLGIAQVLMENPDVLILDEPFNGLDEKSAKKIRNLLLDEKKKGKIVILATHIKEDIITLCDEVYKMDCGNIKKTTNV
ncbi:MAG: ABC transporter ATP-binding protein [bacterium]|nr:ABC transporter ATP-binding protein [bacterium]